MKKYYEDAKDNAAFDRCIDVMVRLMQKYGPSLIEKWDTEQDSQSVTVLPDSQENHLPQIEKAA